MNSLADAKILGLTIHSPWAQLTAEGHKTVECRSWAPYDFMLGRHVAIHASTRWDQEGYEFIERNVQRFLVTAPRAGACSYGIIAVARLVGWVRRTDLGEPGGPVVVKMLPGHAFTPDDWRWFHAGEFGWIWRDIRRIAPVACTGKQKLWRLPDTVVESVRRRYGKAA